MIKSLYIKNFTIINELEIEFRKGLNIITGETGSGKSVLVNAVGQLCGDRSSPDLVRQKANKAIIEARLSVKTTEELEAALKGNEIECDDFSNIIIRKEIYASGNTRLFFNDSPVNMARLNKISSHLIDIHGQHQHQRLLHPEYHIDYLDSFARLNGMREEFKSLLNDYQQTKLELERLKKRQKNAAEKQELYRYQYEELINVALDVEEYENIQAEYNRGLNMESIHEYCRQLIAALYDGEHNAGDNLVIGEHALEKLAVFDREFDTLRESLQNARETVEEIGRFAETYLNDLSFDPERMETLRQRIAQIDFLLKKYNKKDISELAAYKEELENALDSIEGYEGEIKKIEKRIESLTEKINISGQKLSKQRKEQALEFQEKITRQLREIGMLNAIFFIAFSVNENEDSPFILDGRNIAVADYGFDQVVFQIIPNAGEEFKAINKIASGGEISRTMLAIKSVLAETDNLPILIFDEIDSGISGKVAQIVGRKLLQLSGFHQLLCVTHLPQIAAFANEHICVEKTETEKNVQVRAKSLTDDEKVKEIAHLLAGENISVHALENARHLIKEAQEMIER
jgi:DNA repair protein RecN (Recombination protein N)